MKAFLLFLTLGVFAHSGFSQAAETRLTESDKGKVLNFTTKDKGKLVSIQVSDNSGSTGYTWNITENDSLVSAFVGKSMIQSAKSNDGPPIVGAPSPMVYTFKLTGKPGKSHINLALGRSWEKTPAEKNVDVTIIVKAAAKKKK